MRSAAGLLIVGVVLAVGACSDGDQGEADDGLSAEEVAERYGYDVESEELTPVYALVPEFGNSPNDGAIDVFYADCLKDVADYKVPPRSEKADLFSRDHQLMFNEEIAANWGYPALRLPEEEPPGIPSDDVTQEIETEYARCTEELGEKLSRPDGKFLEEVDSAGWNAEAESTELEDAKAAWRDCMAPLGIVDLPEEPHEMPPSSIRGQPNEGDAYVDMDLELTEEERTVAMEDAKCRTEVSLDLTERKARAEGELAAIGKNIEDFEAARVAYERYGEELQALLAEHS